MRIIRALSLAVFLGALATCRGLVPVSPPVPQGTGSPRTQASPSATPSVPTFTPQPTSTPSPSATPTPSVPASQQRHILEVTYTPLWQRLVVHQTLSYSNPGESAIERLPLLAPALTQAFITLQSLQASGREVAYRWDWAQWVLWLTLTPPLAPGETLNLDMRYLLELRPLRTTPEDLTKPMIQGYTQLQVNAVEWHFLVAPQDPQGEWILPQVWPFGEFITYPIGDYTVYLRLPQGWQVAYNGQSFPCPQEDHPPTLCFRVPHARQAVFSLSPVYQVFTGQYSSSSGRTIRLEAYLFAGDKDLGPYVIQVMTQALALFEDYYGPYHRERLVFVVGDFPFSLEYDGIFFVRRSFFFDDPQLRLTAITVHEVAHQWWYAQVHNNPAQAPWMDESLCTYSEVLYYQKYLPDLMTWWWTAYWEGLEPGEGPIDRPLGSYWNYFDYRSLAYLKGALFWKKVHEILKDEGFRTLMHAYVQRYRGRIATPEDLKALLANHLSPQEWEALQREFFTPEEETP